LKNRTINKFHGQVKSAAESKQTSIAAMAEYTSTLSGFQKAMLWSLTGPATEESVQAYADATCAPGFYHIMNGNRIELEDWKKGIAEWRGKTSDYKAEV